ncbi:adenylosuccinate lyase [Kallotenue papyrolyticum]|uniref:adenylosuccinate lyase n=1 Tax=Kallotenue papyrolyticum TaxID=1325125 RepID=UPI0004B0E12E|nr:adenylosuccinate lyase [Kallotenue papyrolyticum]
MRSPLEALSPLDGRYADDVAPLRAYLSEAALYRARVQVEVEYVIFLARSPRIPFVPPLDAAQQGALRNLYRQFSAEDAAAIAAWDRRVNHDVKAVEYWLRERLAALELQAWSEALHWALTSEDVNNLAYAILLREARNQVLAPAIHDIYLALRDLALAYAELPMLARTHGQPATPTTLGKELNVFAHRLHRASDQLNRIRLTGKLNGATGSFAAQRAALPDVDWLRFSQAFVRFLELEPVALTTQIEPHDTLAELCDALRRINTILLDLDMDLWRYISDGWFRQRATPGEVGSSTMPHKVNPIDFENSEGNLHVANALLEMFSRKLPISRLQRDLSDSTVLRTFGTALGHSLVAYRRTLRGLHKIEADEATIRAALADHPEVLAEAVQTILRREGYPEPYEVLKRLTRGRRLTMDDLHRLIESLDVAEGVKAELRALTPETYIGIAPELARLQP